MPIWGRPPFSPRPCPDLNQPAGGPNTEISRIRIPGLLYSGSMTTSDPKAEEKPPPRYPEDAEEPLGLDQYLESDDWAEGFHGRTPFFEGRDAPLDRFEYAIASVSEGPLDDQTLVVQGASGSGPVQYGSGNSDRTTATDSEIPTLPGPVGAGSSNGPEPEPTQPSSEFQNTGRIFSTRYLLNDGIGIR